MASQRRGTIWVERAVVALILASLAGAVNLVISIHHRTMAVPDPIPVAVAPVPQTTEPAQPPPPQVVVTPPRAKPAPVAPAAVPPEDPTKKALAALAGATAREIEEAKQFDKRASEMENARRASVTVAEGWRRREMLVKQQLSTLVRQAEKIDRDVDELAAQRDVLARERDALKAALAKAPGEGSFAVLPYKGENGTWRRPIVLECTNGSVSLRPNGPTFSMLDLSGLINPRSSPVIVSIARELLKIQGSASPDGAPVAPYFVFLVRPDGVRPYYEARARLEPLGIAFGYELIDQDLKVEVPDFDNLATWDGSTPLDVPPSNLAALGSATGAGSGSSTGTGRGGLGDGGGLAWPGGSGGSQSRTGSGVGSGSGRLAGAFGGAGGSRSTGGNGDGDGGVAGGGSPDDFVWPSGRGGGGTVSSSGDGGPLLGGDSKMNGEGTGTGAGMSQGLGRGTKPDAGSGTGAGLALDQLPALEPAEPLARPGSGGSSARPSGGFGTGSGTKLGNGGFSAGAGLKALAEGYDAGRPRGAGPGQAHGLGSSSDPGGGAPTSAHGVGGTEPVASGTGGGPLGSGDLKAELSGHGSDPEPGGPAAGGGALISRPPASSLSGPGSESEAGGNGTSLARSDPASTPATEPGLMWGGGSTETGTGTGAGAKEGDTAKGGGGGSGTGSGSGSGPRPLFSLGANQGTPPGGSQSAVSPGSLGLGLGSLLGSASSSGGGSGSSSSSTSSSGGGGSGLTLGSTASPGAPSSPSSKDIEVEPFIKSQKADKPSPPIDVPFEIVVACGADGLVVHPGGYQITARSLKEERADSLLIRQLVAVAVQRAETDPGIRPKPRVKFLVENNGASTFWEARRQVLFAGLDWPMTLHVTGTQNPTLRDKEIW